MKENLKYWVWLSSLEKVTPRRRYQLIEFFKCPENIWKAKKSELNKIPFAAGETVERLLDEKHRNEVHLHMEKLQGFNISAVTINDDVYPCCLKNIYDPPVVLYIKGELKKDEKSVAVVGSRNATPYGLRIAERLSFDLASRRIAIVSGMARGIDSSAHNGALAAGGRTIAVLGCGVDIVYPPENRTLMEKIISHGAVISEYLPGSRPVPHNFPARNRIISGISMGTVIVEANKKSGSLITADFALEQGREVFAVPGNISSSRSSGTNGLIRDGAKIVTGVDDILEELKIINCAKNKAGYNCRAPDDRINGLDEKEKKIAECLFSEPQHINLIIKDSGLSTPDVNSSLVMLELKGIIEEIPGKYFRLKD